MEGKKLKSNIKVLRVKQKISQMQLAKMMGVTHATVRNWDHGRSGLEVFDMVARLCEALDCHPRELTTAEKEELLKKIAA